MEHIKTILDRIVADIRLRWLERQIKDDFNSELSLKIDKAIRRYDK